MRYYDFIIFLEILLLGLNSIYMDVGHSYLEGNADAVEFCPHDSFHNVLAASTYTLQEGDRPSRAGSISLFDVDTDACRLNLTQRLETAGIFDIKWNSGFVQNMGHPLLAQADADGYVRIHSLQSSDLDGSDVYGNYLKELCGKHISSSMCLCIDWNPSSTSMTVGLSDGSVSIISMHESQLNILQDWKAHEFEVWATSFDVHQPQLVYTGSDDCKFSCWDCRDDPSNSVFQNAKVHKMGICSIAKSPSDPNIVLTGCYDEHLRVWDVRSISYPISETSICLGGGVWRVKHHPSIPGLILTACMHNGFAVVKIKDGRAEVIETYKKHDSLAYGADWQRGVSFVAGRRNSKAIATCSFYDRLLRIWIPERDIFN